jgi:hypothetical protein
MTANISDQIKPTLHLKTPIQPPQELRLNKNVTKYKTGAGLGEAESAIGPSN